MPSLPEGARYLWRHFLEIHSGRTVNGMSPNKASHLDIWAWQQNTGNRLEPWEVRAVNALGNLWLKAQIEAQDRADAARRAGKGN